jgi:hypothetical protein
MASDSRDGRQMALGPWRHLQGQVGRQRGVGDSVRDSVQSDPGQRILSQYLR